MIIAVLEEIDSVVKYWNYEGEQLAPTVLLTAVSVNISY